MNKFVLFLTILFLFFNLSQKSYSLGLPNYKKGEIISGEINYGKRLKIPLPPGDWTVFDVGGENFWSRIWTKSINLVRTDNNTYIEGFDVSYLNLSGYGSFHHHLTVEIKRICKQEEESLYFLICNVKGSTINAFLLGHTDVLKELYTPDNPNDFFDEDKNMWRRWIKENPDFNVPEIILGDEHAFLFPSISNLVIAISYDFNPLAMGQKIKYFTEEGSEYHKKNINKYPEHKKFIENYLKEAAQRHVIYENAIKLKRSQRMDLSSLLTKEEKVGNNITKKLSDLFKLYEQGILTDVEYAKAKKRILESK